jgi:hypothetical protein
MMLIRGMKTLTMQQQVYINLNSLFDASHTGTHKLQADGRVGFEGFYDDLFLLIEKKLNV